MKTGQSKTVTLVVGRHGLSKFNAATDRREILPGEYKVMGGASSATLPLSGAVKPDGGK